MALEIMGKEFLLEGCPKCKLIRAYEFPDGTVTVLWEDISPTTMCKGPDGSILVFDEEKKSVLQMDRAGIKFHTSYSFGRENVFKMGYSDGTVVILEGDRNVLTGVRLETGLVAWQIKDIQFGPQSQDVNNLQNTLTLPDERICVFSNRKLFVLDPKDGTILYTLLDSEQLKLGTIWEIANSCSEIENIFAILHGELQHTKITCYKLTPSQIDWNIKLQYIMSGEGNPDTFD